MIGYSWRESGNNGQLVYCVYVAAHDLFFVSFDAETDKERLCRTQGNGGGVRKSKS